MSTLRRVIKIGGDENNAAENLKRIQITKTLKTSTIIEPTKRAALGELGNRAVSATSLKGKDVQLKDNLKEAKHVNLRNVVKPRIDTHWKKTSILGTKPLTRTDSLKSINSITSGTTVGLKRTNSVKNIADLVATSSAVTNKSSAITVRPITRINSKVITTKSVIVPTINTKDELPTFRREDSNLSKRSITKLRAALTKDIKKDANKITKNEKPINEITKTVNNIQKIVKDDKPSIKDIQRVKIKESEIVSHSEEMLNLIDNIDINDAEVLIRVPEYVNDIYSYLYTLELLFPIEFDYMKNQIEVTPKMRSVLLDWVNETSHQFHLLEETYQMIVGIIDRYLQAVPTITRKNLQLVGVTAIFIATKYEELYPTEIPDLVYITDSTYNKSQILSMERKIMKALDFQLSRPNSIIFLRRYSKAAKAVDEQYFCAKYITELLSIEYSFAHYKPSEIAASALYLSMQLFNKNNTPIEKLWTPTLQFYSRYDINHLKPIVRKVAKIVFEAPQAKLKAVYKKFESNRFHKISTKSELYGPLIAKIISSE